MTKMFDKEIARTHVENFKIKNNVIHGIEADLKLATNHVGEMIFNKLSEKPNHVAQIDAANGETTNFAQMKDKSVRCALWLKKQGLDCGDVVSIVTNNHLDTYVPIFATFYLGAIYNPWNHTLSLETARNLMGRLKPKVIFTCEEKVDTMLEAARLENVDTKVVVYGNHANAESLNNIIATESSEEVASFHPKALSNPGEIIGYIGLSSGSTGESKAIMHSYESTLKNTLLFGPFPAEKLTLSYSAPYWATHLDLTIQSLLYEGTKVIHEKFNAEDTCQVIEKYKVHFLCLTPITISHLCKSGVLKKHKLDSLRFVVTTGSSISADLFKEFKKAIPQATMVQAYGTTETLRCMIMQTAKAKSVESIGFAGPNVQVKVIDMKGQALGPNQRGELCVKTSTLMIGYYGHPELTKEAKDDEGWLHTGDVGYYNENGEIFTVGRFKEIIRFRDHYVYPLEIEDVLLTHPAVLEVCVVPIPHKSDGHRPMAFVRKISEIHVTEEELVNLSATLGEHKQLSGGIKFLKELPKIASGKFHKVELKEAAKHMLVYK